MSTAEIQQLVTDHFIQYISDHKRDFVERVLASRTRHITLVMEDIYQSQNASAVIRTCECMGVQDVHIIQNVAKYSINPRVLKGSDKWMNLIHYKTKDINNTEECFTALRSQGYKILVTDPSPDGVSIHDVPLNEKLAVVMGNELRGSSDYAINHADQKVHIPMVGFTESLNISVSAAICLSTLISKLHTSDVDWKLSDADKDEMRYLWYKKIVRRSGLIEKEFLMRYEASGGNRH